MVPSGDRAHTPEWSGSWYTRTSTRSPGPRVRRVSAPAGAADAGAVEVSVRGAGVAVRHAVSVPSNNTSRERMRITEAGSVRHGHPNIAFVPVVVDSAAGLGGRPELEQVADPP